MKLSTLKKEIHIVYENKLSSKEQTGIETIIEQIKLEKSDLNFRGNYEENVVFWSNELQDVIDVYNKIKDFSIKKKIKYRVLLLAGTIVDLEENMTAYRFIGDYLRLPDGNSNAEAMSLRFMYDVDGVSVLVMLERAGEFEVGISVCDVMDKEMDFIKTYDRLVATIHKIINF